MIENEPSPKDSPWKMAHLGIEFASGIFVGVALGYLVDTWLGTMPWFIVIFVVLGMTAGILNVKRAIDKMSSSSPPTKENDHA